MPSTVPNIDTHLIWGIINILILQRTLRPETASCFPEISQLQRGRAEMETMLL